MPINVYKVIFAKDDAVACELSQNKIKFEGQYMYEQHIGGGA